MKPVLNADKPSRHQDDVYYAAMLARDPRFDGKFFVGVKTTGIYCRPICPAKPKRENVVFFHNHIEAERHGFRPCLRCRPESAPKSPAWIGKTAIVQRAVKMLHQHDVIVLNEDVFAARFGVSARHLRRLFIDEIGKTPKQLSFENRLGLARKLISETQLPMSEVAFASGFQSIRRFNDAFRDRFKRNPTEIRRTPVSKNMRPMTMQLTLPYRPPFDFQSLLAFYRSHQVGELERFTDETMTRVIEHEGKIGEVTIRNDAENSRLVLDIDFPNSAVTHSLLARVRAMFDLDSDPIVIANHLENDPPMRKLVSKFPGTRLPSGWDPFEIAISAILGQLVSVQRGRQLVSDVMMIAGSEKKVGDRVIRFFPTPEQIVKADLGPLRTTGARKRALVAFAEAVRSGALSLEATQDVEVFKEKILSISGIGPWTANYMALKVLRHTDAFPGTDLILARALKIHSEEVIATLSPWRAYAAILLWREYAGKPVEKTAKSKKKMKKSLKRNSAKPGGPSGKRKKKTLSKRRK